MKQSPKNSYSNTSRKKKTSSTSASQKNFTKTKVPITMSIFAMIQEKMLEMTSISTSQESTILTFSKLTIPMDGTSTSKKTVTSLNSEHTNSKILIFTNLLGQTITTHSSNLQDPRKYVTNTQWKHGDPLNKLTQPLTLKMKSKEHTMNYSTTTTSTFPTKPLSSLDLLEWEKLFSPRPNVQNLLYSAPTWMTSNTSEQTFINQLFSTTCPSNTCQELDKSTSPISMKQDQFTSDTEWQEFLQELSDG